MTRLRDDTFARRGRPSRQRRTISATVFVFLFLSVALLVLSRLDHPYVAAMRSAVTPILAPVLSSLSEPLQPVREAFSRLEGLFVSQDEMRRLRAENERLKSWEWRAKDLQRQLDALGRVAKIAPEANIPFVTARVVADARGPFAQSIVIDVGRDRGVQVGHPVINTEGLVGRIVEASASAARVLLLNDSDMRIPVQIGSADERGIAVGENSGRMRMKHLRREASLRPGDVVATSGRGGLFPRALRIGVVERNGTAWTVRPFADVTRIDLVSVLLFESPLATLAEPGVTKRIPPEQRDQSNE